MCLLWNILWDEEAATAVEYAVMLAMILLSVIGAISVVGGEAGGMWGNIRSDLQNVGFVN
jgi:Flp pilus assembly pilin Flp